MSKRRVCEQFSANAEAYVTSEVHAKGLNLGRLIELTCPKTDWRVLDVATGAGHTALAFAPLVKQVVAGDITHRMLELTAKLAEERDQRNVLPVAADAEKLPFSAGQFNLVTCRVAAHHFPAVEDFMNESARTLCSGGMLAIVDNVVPGGRSGSKEGRLAEEVCRYVNAFETLRDPSHVRCLSIDEWQRSFYQAGFRLLRHEITYKMLDFHDWTARMRVHPADEIRLESMLCKAPAEVTNFLQPEFDTGRISFRLAVALFIGVKE